MPHCIQLPETPVLQLLWNYKTHEALQDSHSHRHDFQRQMHHGICSFTTDGGDWTLPIPALKVCYFGSVVYVTPSEDQDGGVCVAVIAKENYPLYIRSIPTEDQLKFHYTTHTSPDVVDEKISAMGKALVDQRELYLGLLYATEDYKVYGYVTNSKVKFVMVVDSSNTDFRNNEIRSMFRKLHNSYTDVMCNPFYNPGDTIQSRAFDNTVSSMMVPAC